MVSGVTRSFKQLQRYNRLKIVVVRMRTMLKFVLKLKLIFIGILTHFCGYILAKPIVNKTFRTMMYKKSSR